MIQHSDMGGIEAHSPFRWVVDTEADIASIPAPTEKDVNKTLLVRNTQKQYYLHAHSPVTWKALSGGTGTGTGEQGPAGPVLYS